MRLEINGQSRADVPAGTIVDLLAWLGMEPPAVLVEHNGNALLRSEWAQTTLREGDRVEILRVAAGG